MQLVLPSVHAKENISPMKVDVKQVAQWNDFSDSLYVLHQSLLKNTQVRTEEEVGGYGGVTAGDFYTEIRYYDKKTNTLLSQIQWELERPTVIHNIEVFIYDDGRLVRDYYAGYLPHHRNAPLHTMVNFYGEQEGLRSFRQFDASGERIYEQCSGKHFSEDVDISLENDEWLSSSSESLKLISSEPYIACFGDTPTEIGKYINPLIELPGNTKTAIFNNDIDEYSLTNKRIEALSRKIASQINLAPLYTKRAEEYFNLGEFDKSEKDLTKAIEIDAEYSQAWFWRGMVRGRSGKISDGIADLSVFIKRHPNSSLAYTKRGVRYIWNGQLENAAYDLLRAIELNPANAEAHDDLGVLLAQRKNFSEAIRHFRTTLRIEPNYQKAHHNLATALYLKGQIQAALYSVDHSLQLAPSDRGSLMLKSEILLVLGRNTEAMTIRERAEFLPEGNWSERFIQP
ncbi:MAG: tetratricopeptide repeat protein [Sulfuriflexus sp.]|nr:tetratricopeptide repeat protein [Sulfuriflexus sp.]